MPTVYGYTLSRLQSCYQNGDRETALHLVKTGADLESLGQDGAPVLFDAAVKNDVDFAKALIEHGAKVNAQNVEGYSALHNAVSHGHQEMVELLYNAGADINIASHWGETPLMTAAERGQYAAAEQLLALGADPNRLSESGEAALHLACNQTVFHKNDRSMVDLLIRHTVYEVWKNTSNTVLRFDQRDIMVPYVETVYERLVLQANVPDAQGVPSPRRSMRL